MSPVYFSICTAASFFFMRAWNVFLFTKDGKVVYSSACHQYTSQFAQLVLTRVKVISVRKVKGCFTRHPHVPRICAGPLADFDLPVDSITKRCKGFAHVVYMMPEHAVKAFTELDGKTFMVRNCASRLEDLITCQPLCDCLKELTSETEQGPECSCSQHTRELIGARNTSHKYNNKDLTHLQ